MSKHWVVRLGKRRCHLVQRYWLPVEGVCAVVRKDLRIFRMLEFLNPAEGEKRLGLIAVEHEHLAELSK